MQDKITTDVKIVVEHVAVFVGFIVVDLSIVEPNEDE